MVLLPSQPQKSASSEEWGAWTLEKVPFAGVGCRVGGWRQLEAGAKPHKSRAKLVVCRAMGLGWREVTSGTESFLSPAAQET